MAIVKKYLAKDNFTKVDNRVLHDKNLSDQAKLLYCYMASFKNGFQLNDGLIVSELGWSKRKVSMYKTELSESRLILVDKIDRTTYLLYIGSSSIPADKVKDNWTKLERGNG